MTTATVTAADYQRAFEAERIWEYPVIDAMETRYGYAVERQRLEAAARVLACPLKNHPPNWQHGRVLYAVARQTLKDRAGSVSVLDIGTAKGFSALCLLWALQDSGASGKVTSIDVLDPHTAVRRNTVAEVDGFKTLAQTLEPWPEAQKIEFLRATGIAWLSVTKGQIAFAFVDGKHSGSVVAQEGRLIAARQKPGDVTVFDDVHLGDVAEAVDDLRDVFTVERIDLMPHRAYVIGVRRG